MKRLDQLKRSLKSYTNRVAMNKERLLNESTSKQLLRRAKKSIPRYERKIKLVLAEIEIYLAGRKKVKRKFKTVEEKRAIIRPSVEMPNDSKQWLKPLRENNLKNKEVVKPKYF
jgi:hypothetical protein